MMRGSQVASRIASNFSLGRVTLVDDTGPAQRVQVGIDARQSLEAVPALYQFGFSSSPPAMSDVMVSFIHGDRSKPVILATGHQTYRVRGLKPGDTVQHDIRGQSITCGPEGIVIDGAGQDLPITIRNALKVRIEGDLEVTGEITAKAGTAAAITLTPHTHTDSRGGTTSAPNPGT